MSFEFVHTPGFIKSFDRYPSQKQILITKAVESIQNYFMSSRASYGLRIKKLHQSNLGKVFEARVNIDIRVIWVEQGNKIVFSLLGNHEDVRRFIRNL